MKFNVLLLLVLFADSVRSQGLLLNDDEYRKTPALAAEYTGAKTSSDLLQNTFKVDLKPYCPTVRAQGDVSSCVGWSVGYAAMTIENAIRNGWGGDQGRIDDNAFSAMYVYNQIKLGDCFFGAELNRAFGILSEKGNVFYRDFAVGNNCDSLPAGRLVEKARINKVKAFTTLFDPEDNPDVKVERVRATLLRNTPVVIGMSVLEHFLSLKSTDHVWYPNVGKTDLFGGHAMVVVGYDDGLKAFEIMNSWGEGWANHGFVWVRYDDFAKYCKYAYQLFLEKEEDAGHLEGTLRVNRPVMQSATDGEIDVIFSPLAFRFAGDRYSLTDTIRAPLDFQLVAENFRRDGYLYVIVFANDLKPLVHWPRNEKLNKKFSGEHDSPIITADEGSVTLPSRYKVFRISEPGVEYLCVLNSNAPVKNLTEKLGQVRGAKGELPERLRKVFGSRSQLNSVFENDRISFLSRMEKPGIVTMLLEFSTQK